MEHNWYDDKSMQELERETAALALMDLTQEIVDDDEALHVMFEAVAIAMEWRKESTNACGNYARNLPAVTI